MTVSSTRIIVLRSANDAVSTIIIGTIVQDRKKPKEKEGEREGERCKVKEKERETEREVALER